MTKDEEAEPAPVCGVCLGAGGEWIDQNGDSNQQAKWVSCKTCSGTGRK
ncbi:hypothetical protein ACFOY2_16750 [Nonomuraea purpurea]|uniref:Molecular chaperone DnaJ n=1 Tax=Nonomuraea purpurea TaxID=1849276 RepID=A0ABV8G4J4_9ACTN